MLAMKAQDADEFVYELSAKGRAVASMNRDVAAASSFFGFIERRYEAIRNPFRGTRARRAPKPVRQQPIPRSARPWPSLAASRGT